MSNLNCTHCKESIVVPVKIKVDNSELLFCCQGCKSVYEILHSNGLEKYYELMESSNGFTNGPVQTSNEKYLFLDDNDFIQKYAKESPETFSMKFYLEGIHCVACLWLIEKLPEFTPGVIYSELNMSKSTCLITITKNGKFSKVAKQLQLLGYKPHPILEDGDVETFNRNEDRKMLIKIGVAFACAGNIMLLATSLYAGLEEELLRNYFRWLNLIISLPVILFSAIPFYQSALSALRNKQISIDVPIVIAIILVTISGIYNLLTDGEHLYFDSITVLIFLLLFARFILKKAQQKGLSATEVSSFFNNQVAYRILDNSQEPEIVHAKFLKPYEKILIPAGENIPVDGLILEGVSNINSSLLTGESLPEAVTKGSYVYSGTINLSADIVVQVLKSSEDSRFGKILRSVESGWNQKAPIVQLADKIAKYFVYSVFTLAFFVIIFFALQGNATEGFTRALTLIIITCPCALGLTTPLALTLTLGRLAKVGIIIKNETIIEKITKAKDIFLDKTGTLTHGDFEVIDHVIHNVTDINYDHFIYSIEKKSHHPIARAICRYFENIYYENKKLITPTDIKEFKEIPGVGVEADFEGKIVQLKASEKNNNKKMTAIGLFQDGLELQTFYLKDKLRKDAIESINQIQNLGLRPFLLSGDNQESVDDIASQLGLNKDNVFAKVSPETKNQFITNHPNSIMVGDGANDAIALSNAYIGIAVHGSVDISLRAADIYISKPGVNYLAKLLYAAKDTVRIIHRNLWFSLIYNIFGAFLSVTGSITPLLAAILMPVSSLTVLISTLISTKRLNQIDKL